MKILSAEQIRECDRHTIVSQNISSENLMFRAASECTDWLLENFAHESRYYVFCGSGNNGGDGLLIAHYLHLSGCEVVIFIDKNAEKTSREFQHYYDIISEGQQIKLLDFSDASLEKFDGNAVIIDAVFGIGLNKELSPKISQLIHFLNDRKGIKIAIDIPTGLSADAALLENAEIFKADHTLSFHFYKWSFLHPETAKYCGKIHILKIGLDEDFAETLASDHFIIDDKCVQDIYRPREDFSNKGTYGKSCIVAGSLGKIGAAVLATKAALRSGSGLTFSAVPNCGTVILQTVCPEAMVMISGENQIENLEIPEDCTVGIGPGIGTDEKTASALLSFLKNYQKPLILDADALNILAKSAENLSLIPKNAIITPHPKEFERLFGKAENSFQRLESAKKFAKNLEIIIVLKDHHTQVILPNGRVFYNITGNSGMAKGGSGDALTGILTALLAQKYEPWQAAVFGVWLHGKAGDFAAEKYSKEAMLPMDLIEEIGTVFKNLH